jgi:hypothetical protein
MLNESKVMRQDRINPVTGQNEPVFFVRMDTAPFKSRAEAEGFAMNMMHSGCLALINTSGIRLSRQNNKPDQIEHLKECS